MKEKGERRVIKLILMIFVCDVMGIVKYSRFLYISI